MDSYYRNGSDKHSDEKLRSMEEKWKLIQSLQIGEVVVVTALGIKREKKMLGYAVQELKSDELNKQRAPVCDQCLAR